MSRCRIISFSSAQILYFFSAEKHLNVHFPTFLLSVFLLPDITATTANQRNTPQKSRYFPSEITWKSCRNHRNFWRKSRQLLEEIYAISVVVIMNKKLLFYLKKSAEMFGYMENI